MQLIRDLGHAIFCTVAVGAALEKSSIFMLGYANTKFLMQPFFADETCL